MRGNKPENFHLLQKYVNFPKSLYCNFCQSIGHDQSDCHSWKMMNDRNMGFYGVRGEDMPETSTVQISEQRGGYGGGYRG